MIYAAHDLPDEWRSPPGTRGANARLGTFRQLTGHNIPDIFSFTYWLGSNSSGDSGAATHEVAGTGWSIAEFIKGIIWALRKLRSDYEEHKLQQRDLESQNTAHAVATLDSFTQVRGILDALRADGLALRAELVAMRSESVHGATLAFEFQVAESVDAVKAEQHRLQRLIWDQAAELATVAQQTGRMEESLRHYQLAYSGRLDEIATSHLNLETQFRGERVRLDASTARVAGLIDQFRGERVRNERVEHVELVQVRADVSRTWKRVEHESTRGDNYHRRLEQLEAGTAPSDLASFANIIRHRISNLDRQVSGLLFPDGVPQPDPTASPASD
jgi:hypothetical protein